MGSCSAFSAFIRCREGDGTNPSTSGNMMSFANPAQLGVLPHPLQVSNLNIVQQHSGGFRGSGMLTLQDLSSMGREDQGWERSSDREKARGHQEVQREEESENIQEEG